MLPRTACLTVIALSAIPAGGSAQKSSPDSTFRAATNGLAIGTPLRVISAAGDTTYARLLGVGALGLQWEDEIHGAGETLVPEIRELSAERSAWRKGVLIGGALGAVFGAVVGEVGDQTTTELVVLTSIWSALGGIGGAVVGSGIREWDVVYDGGERAP